MLKKLLVAVLLFAILATNFALFVPSTARAQAPPGPWYNTSFQEFYTKVYDEKVSPPQEIFGERYTAAQVQWVIYGLFSFILNQVSSREVLSCVMTNMADVGACLEAIQNLLSSNTPQNEAVASSKNQSLLSAVFEERPFSGIGYFREKARNLKIIPEVSAQGFGFTGALSPIQGMWRVSRNITYSLLVVAVLILAFMIMFRVKTSPQTVITVQSALPKVAVAIVLITFSYAIAGFLVDLMYVVIGIVSLMGSQFFPSVLGFSLSPADVFGFLTKGHPFQLLDTNAGIFFLFFLYIIAFILGLIVSLFAFLGGIVSVLAGFAGVAIVGLLGPLAGYLGAVLLIILTVVLLFLFFKILWTLLKAFARVLLLTIFAPFYILIGVLTPGMGFSSWLKTFASNLSVFVVVGTLFLLSYVFLAQGVFLAGEQLLGGGVGDAILKLLFGTLAATVGSGIVESGSSAGWPPLLGFGEASTPLLLLGVSFAIFAIIPQTADLIKSVIERRPFTFGTALGEATGAAWGISGGRGYLRATQEERSIVKVQKIREAVQASKLSHKVKSFVGGEEPK
ncbi:hypothetical protein IID21_03510 [Patescibacteria group bacterium]|nr:hypothetical protein [Patescibacteria group bacterium]